jgi:serine/threonine protein kinase
MPAAPLAPGLPLGPFRLERRLAIGGTAEIWAAEAPGAGAVALKVLHPHLAADATFRAMLLDEVAIARRLRHPAVIEVFGAHEDGGHLYLAMAHVDGADLRRVQAALARAGERFPVTLALVVARALAQGLDHAHRQRDARGRPLGIVHRDVSPHNVMLARDGGVKLLDFGAARAEERLAATRTGVIKGKPGYMAPEQALGQAVTARTDVFATGVLLWELLAGARLFDAPTDDTRLERALRGDAPPVPRPETPAEVAALVARMLARHPDDRPASMREVDAGLARALARSAAPAEASPEALARWLAPRLGASTARRAARGEDVTAELDDVRPER